MVKMIIKSTLGNFQLYKVYNNNSSSISIKQYVILDNSVSMGKNTKNCLDYIVKGLFDISNNVVIGLFSDNIIFNQINSKSQIDSIYIPRQGSTNITHAIQMTLQHIIEDNDINSHYIITFLSDGDHNKGPVLTENSLNIYKTDHLKITFNVVGIGKSNTSLGMMIKSKIENVRIDSLQSVYYADGFFRMNTVLEDMVKNIKSSLNGKILNLELDSGFFIENKSKNINLYVEDVSYLIAMNSNIILDNEITEEEVKYEDICKGLNSIFPKLSQIKIGTNTEKIREQVLWLESIISFYEEFTKTGLSSEDIGQIKLKPKQRLDLLKSIKTSSCKFAEEKNKLKSLLLTVENNSSKQAEYLTGINKKYSTKAINRSNVIDKSQEQIHNEILTIRDNFQESLEQIKPNENISFLSLLNIKEQFEEWNESFDTMTDDIYSKLILMGFSGYPVSFLNNNAVQMDAYQTCCTFIEPYLVDSSSVFLANQVNRKITTPSRKEFKDVLFLIDPSCWETCLVAKRSCLYQYLCSVTLCRDLYMYSSKMPLSLHCHSLIKAASYNETIYKDLSLRIIYSYNKIKRNDDIRLYNHWLEGNTITTSQKDDCSHPIQLIPMVSYCDQIPDTTILLNLLNEVMARHMKIILKDVDCIKLLQEVFSINSNNCPAPLEQIDLEEPTLEATREKCQHWAEINKESKLFSIIKGKISDYVNSLLINYVRAYHICLTVKLFGNFVEKTEQQGKIPDELLSLLTNLPENIYEYLGITDVELVSKNILFQAILHHTSESRVNIVNCDVRNSVTLQNIIIDLRMYIYFELCKIKREKWEALRGNFTYQQADQGSEEEFRKIIGKHTHGLSKDEFWALVRASKYNQNKKKEFLSKSNNTVESCYSKV